MAIKSEAIIYKIIEQHLRESSEPLTCQTLWDFDDVKQHARSPEKVSDFLGLMWRRDLIQRWNTPKTSTDRSRYGYTWNEDPEADKHRKISTLTVATTTHKKANVTITEADDKIILDFDRFTLTVQAKG